MSVGKEIKFRIVGITGEKEAEERMSAVCAEMARDGWTFKEVQYRSFEFQGIRHSALMVFERLVEVANTAKVQGLGTKGGLS